MFCLRVPKMVVWDTSIFQKKSSMQKILGKRRGVMFLGRKLFVTHCWKFSRGTLQCLRIFGAWKNLKQKTRASRFFVETYTVLKNLAEIPSVFQKIGVSKNLTDNIGYHIFPLAIFCLIVRKILVGRRGEPCYSEMLWCRKHLGYLGNHDFFEVSLSDSTKKIIGEHFNFPENF